MVGDSITVGVGTSGPAHRYATVLAGMLRGEDLQIVEKTKPLAVLENRKCGWNSAQTACLARNGCQIGWK